MDTYKSPFEWGELEVKKLGNYIHIHVTNIEADGEPDQAASHALSLAEAQKLGHWLISVSQNS